MNEASKSVTKPIGL